METHISRVIKLQAKSYVSIERFNVHLNFSVKKKKKKKEK